MTTSDNRHLFPAVFLALGLVIAGGGWAAAAVTPDTAPPAARPDADPLPFALPPIVGQATPGTLETLSKFGAPDDANLPDSAGYEFYIISTVNYSLSSNSLLVLASKENASGTVTIPALSFAEDFAITAGGLATVTIPATAMVSAEDSVSVGKGIHIVADHEITVYFLSPDTPQYTNDGLLGLPVDILGTSYYVMGWYGYYYASHFAVVGTQEGTTVTITPGALMGTKPAGVPYNVTLNAGDVYFISAASGSSNDVTGTRIDANKPVGVVGGHRCANVPLGYGYCDFLTEMMFPLTTWGRDYLVTPFKGPLHGDVLRVLAGYDDTQVSINGTVEATLSAGQFYEKIPFTTPQVITTSKPALVAQFLTGSTYAGTVTDPSMCLIPPKEQYLSDYIFLNLPYFTTQYVKMIAPTVATGSCEVDAVPVTGWEAIPDTGYSTVDWQLSSGTHSTSCSLPFGIEVVGYYPDTSYAYPGGLALVNLLGAALFADQTLFTSPGEVTLTVVINDDEGNPLSDVDVDFEVVSGPNAGKTGSGTTDENGEATWAYEGRAKGVDTVVASFIDGEEVRQSNQVLINWDFIDVSPPVVTIHVPKRQKLMWAQGKYRKLTFTVKDDTGSIREGLWVDQCLVYDGDLYGDQDGILRDEYIYIDQSHMLCAAYHRCGIKRWNNPVVTVTAEDIGGNMGWDKIFIGGRYTVSPSRCR